MSNVAGTDFTGLLVSQMGDVDGDGVPDLGTGASHFDYNDTTWLGIWSGADIGSGGAYGQSAALAVISATGRGGDIVTGIDSDGELKVADYSGVHALAEALKVNAVLTKLE